MINGLWEVLNLIVHNHVKDEAIEPVVPLLVCNLLSLEEDFSDLRSGINRFVSILYIIRPQNVVALRFDVLGLKVGSYCQDSSSVGGCLGSL